MGTDIHSLVQIKKNGKWTNLDVRLSDDRDYDTFSVLADVRNGYGFAGVITGEPWDVLFEPRGLPEDLKVDQDNSVKSKTWFYEYDSDEKHPQDRISLGDHTFSWLLLSELVEMKNHFKRKDRVCNGIVDRENFIEMKNKNQSVPTSYSGGVFGGLTKVVDQEYADLKNEWTHVRMEWTTSAMYRLHLLNKYIKEITEIADKNLLASSDIRIVFGFDS